MQTMQNLNALFELHINNERLVKMALDSMAYLLQINCDLGLHDMRDKIIYVIYNCTYLTKHSLDINQANIESIKILLIYTLRNKNELKQTWK